MVRPTLRRKTIGTKTTEEEYAELERTAQGDKTLGNRGGQRKSEASLKLAITRILGQLQQNRSVSLAL